MKLLRKREKGRGGSEWKMSKIAGGSIDSACDSPEGHCAAGGRLFEPGSSENSVWIETAAVHQYKHEVACSE